MRLDHHTAMQNMAPTRLPLKYSRRVCLLLPTLAFLLATAILFKPIWWDGMILGFRDTLHFYYPMWHFIDGLPITDRLLPLWNPLEAFGCSIAGEPTSMVFYPPRLILHIHYGSIEQRIGIFILLHLWIAYGAWVYAGWRLGYEAWIVQLTGAAFSLSGPVFFQINNPIFLVGAAWLPLMLYGSLRLLNVAGGPSNETLEESGRVPYSQAICESLICLIVASSMSILGGDPQSVIHAGMLISILAIILFAKRQFEARSFNLQYAWSLLISVTLIVFGFMMTFGLTAIQNLTTAHWLSKSERAYDFGIMTKNGFREVHALHSPYAYSVHPVQYATAVLPNITGQSLTHVDRWAISIGDYEDFWLNSLHAGTLIVIAASLFWICSFRSEVACVTFCVAVVAMLSSFGRYSLFDLWLYWIPGYDRFRFPGKWTPFFAWALCFASMGGLSFEMSEATRRNFRWGGILVAIPAIIALGFYSLLSLDAQSRTAFFRDLSSRSKVLSNENDVHQILFDAPSTMSVFGYNSCVSLGTCALIWVLFRSKKVSMTFGKLSLCLVTLIELLFAASPSVTLLQPSAIDPLPNITRSSLGSDFSLNWDLEALDNNGIQVSQSLKDRGISEVWKFGNLSLPTFLRFDQAKPRKPQEATSKPDQDRSYEGDMIFGKIGLLKDLRSFQTGFSLGPRIMYLMGFKDMGEDTIAPAEGYWKHYVSSIDSPPTWPPTPDRLAEEVVFEEVVLKSNRLEFSYDSPKDFYLQLPMLNDGGWYDAAESDKSKVLVGPNDLLVVELQAGKHRVELGYFPDGLKQGALVSLLSLMLSIGLCVVYLWSVRARRSF